MIPMNGRERIRQLLAGNLTDRPPVMASFIAWGAEARGIPQHRIHQESSTNASTLVGLSRELGLDGVYLSSDNWIIHSALGGTVDFPDDDEPMGRRTVLDEWDRLDDLRVPDPRTAGRMPFMLDVARQAVASNQNEMFLEGNIDSGPFTMAGILRGAQQWMLDVVEEPQKAHRLLAFCTEVASVYGRAMAATGVDAIQFGDSTATLVGREMYEEFVHPYQKSVIRALGQTGIYPFLHVCGNSNHLTDLLADSGAACVEIDAPADLKRTIDALGDRMAVRGNVPTMLLHDGPVSKVEAAARTCLKIANSHRFILSPGCGVPRGTPRENLRALVRVARSAFDKT